MQLIGESATKPAWASRPRQKVTRTRGARLPTPSGEPGPVPRHFPPASRATSAGGLALNPNGHWSHVPLPDWKRIVPRPPTPPPAHMVNGPMYRRQICRSNNQGLAPNLKMATGPHSNLRASMQYQHLANTTPRFAQIRAQNTLFATNFGRRTTPRSRLEAPGVDPRRFPRLGYQLKRRQRAQRRSLLGLHRARAEKASASPPPHRLLQRTMAKRDKDANHGILGTTKPIFHFDANRLPTSWQVCGMHYKRLGGSARPHRKFVRSHLLPSVSILGLSLLARRQPRSKGLVPTLLQAPSCLAHVVEVSAYRCSSCNHAAGYGARRHIVHPTSHQRSSRSMINHSAPMVVKTLCRASWGDGEGCNCLAADTQHN